MPIRRISDQETQPSIIPGVHFLAADEQPAPGALLHCPIRGALNVHALAKDGLTASEEARRIDFINFLLDRQYPKTNIAVETIIIKKLGESGRNTLRCDVIIYDVAAVELDHLPIEDRIARAILVAEIKRDSYKKVSAWKHQLEPAMRLLPGMQVMGAYWDDIDRLLFVKEIAKDQLRIFEDSLANLPLWGAAYRRKLLTQLDLNENTNLVGVLFNIANIMRSHGINDEHVRYKETVKLLLARYCDEREAQGSSSKPLALQVYPKADNPQLEEPDDPNFMTRVTECYTTASKRYSRAKTIFSSGHPLTELTERSLREIIRKIQGINFHSASNETMQQVFMSFVPAVFKKSLDQYFTPIGLVKAMVEMVKIGPNDKIADPGMGTADFLTAAAEVRANAGDTDSLQRIYGWDSDAKAFDLAVVNMILNKDGQSNLYLQDSIEHYDRHEGEMGVVLCNPPFGERSVETRISVLRHYDLGHEWDYNDKTNKWERTSRLQQRQQLGIMFIERCYKLLDKNGRLAIILPEGYLSTPMYGYVRRAVEGIVTPSHPTRAWQIADRKQENLYHLQSGDIIIGLVRPERRNIGLLLAEGDDIVGTPDGIAVVRARSEQRHRYPQQWLFATLRSESCRLQFWTESGGTSYGKLTRDHLENALVPVPPLSERRGIAGRVNAWACSIERGAVDWSEIGNERNRKPIINSSGFGLIETDDELEEDTED